MKNYLQLVALFCFNCYGAVWGIFSQELIIPIPKLIEGHGYPIEVHRVKTVDGYVLELHRIPHGISNSSQVDSRIPSAYSRGTLHSSNFSAKVDDTKRPVVLLVHCIFCSSSIWVVQGPEKGFSYLLAEEGYDVWMLNVRGSTYSKRHIKYSTKSRKFWDFSWHEMAMNDLPATIDYILDYTKQAQLSYIGYSMGTTLFFALTSYKPEYNEKINKMVALAPACYLSHAKATMVQLADYITLIERFAHDTNMVEVPPDYLNIKENLHNICDYSNVFLRPSCEKIYRFIAGSSFDHLDLKKLNYFFLYYPDTTSVRTVTHFYQVRNSGKFGAYDYGSKKKNYLKYGTTSPPLYNLTKISTPVYLFYAKDDPVTTVKDVIHLKSKLSNVKSSYKIEIPKFSHADFSWGLHAKQIVYDYVIKVLRSS